MTAALLLSLRLRMLLEVLWDEQTTPVDLVDGTVVVGGGPTDDLQLPGLPQGLLTLTIEGERVTVLSSRPVRVGAARLPARVPRLLVAGEDLRLPNEAILRRAIDERQRQARRAIETVAVMKELLAQGVGPDQTRAASLTCVCGVDRGAVFPVAFEVSVLGRDVGADLRIRDPAVSRRHASLRRDGRRYVLGDLSATNGVYVNGVRVQRPRALASGDVIELGQTLLRFDGPERAPRELSTAGEKSSSVSASVSPETPTDRLNRRPLRPVGQGAALEVAGRRLGHLEVAVASIGISLALVGGAVTFFMLR